jgi:hypothetical protein
MTVLERFTCGQKIIAIIVPSPQEVLHVILGIMVVGWGGVDKGARNFSRIREFKPLV